jgi:hypothetical protein
MLKKEWHKFIFYTVVLAVLTTCFLYLTNNFSKIFNSENPMLVTTISRILLFLTPGLVELFSSLFWGERFLNLKFWQRGIGVVSGLILVMFYCFFFYGKFVEAISSDLIADLILVFVLQMTSVLLLSFLMMVFNNRFIPKSKKR